MKYVLIAAYNALLCASMPLQAIQPMTDEDIVESHRRGVLGGSIKPDQAENLVIFKHGYFDDIKGEIEVLPQPVKICALKDFLPRKEVKPVEVNPNVSN